MPVDPFAKGTFLFSRGGVRIEKAAPYSTAMDWLLSIADRLRPKVKAAFLQAVEAARKDVPAAELERLAAEGKYREILALLNAERRMDQLLKGSFAALITQAMSQAGAAAGPKIPRRMLAQPTTPFELEGLFNLINPRVSQFLNNYTAGLVINIGTDTGKAITELLRRANEEGRTPKAVARQIRDVIGLRPDQEKALANYQQRLELAGKMNQQQISKAVERYAKRLLAERADVIARTETMRAVNAGQNLAWQEAEQRELLAPGTRRRWLVTRDDRLCPVCAAIPGMNPEGQRLDEPFQTTMGPVLAPPLHPSCRCAMSLVIAAPPPL